MLNWRTGLLEWWWILHYLCVDVGLGQCSPRISGGRDKMRRKKGQFALDPVLWGWQRPRLIPAWYTHGHHQSCTASAWNHCVFPGCEMHRALPANWGHRDSSNVLRRTCSSIPLFTSRKSSTTYSEAACLALPSSRVEGCSNACHSRELPPSGRSFFSEISSWDVPEMCSA